MTKIRFIGLATACLVATPALALEQGEYMLNGFGTAALTRIGGADDATGYGDEGQTTDSWRGDELSKLGGQFSYGVTDRLSATVQALAKPEQDSWKVDLEWAYLAYEISDELSIRAGRLRSTAYMFSETLDVGYTYPWLRLPEEVYSLFPISNFDGVDALYRKPLPFGVLSLQVNTGTATNRDSYSGAFGGSVDYDAKNIIGGNVSLATSDFGTVRYGYFESDTRVERGEYGYGKFTSLGYQYDNGTLIANAELVERKAFGETVEAFYLMGGYRFDDVLAHVTYAQMDLQDGGRQSSWSYGLNYSLTSNITLKGEYKRVESTDGYPGVFTPNYTTSNPTFDGDIVSIGADFVF